MTLNVHALGAYLVGNFKRRPADSQIYSLVHTLKVSGKAFTINMNDVNGVSHQLGARNRPAAMAIFGAWAAQRLMQLGITTAQLVGVPGSSHIRAGGDFTAGRMAAAAATAAGIPGITANPILYFAAAMQPAHLGNPQARDPLFLAQELRASVAAMGGTVILIDDVVTTGGHMLASARFLRSLGATVDTALCAARTYYRQDPNPLALAPYPLPRG